MPISFSSRDVQRFAQWSADTNPLHVDDAFARQTHFGRRVVHGALTVLRVLDAAAPTVGSRRLRSLDIEFRNAVFIDDVYDVDARLDGEQLTAGLRSAGQLVLGVRAELGMPAPTKNDPSVGWAGTPISRPERETPAHHEPAEFVSGLETTGRYAMRSALDSETGAGLSVTQATVLGLCSYVTGMEVPGLRSLFTRITIRFTRDADDAGELWYRARTVRFDQSFRILDTELQIVTPDQRLVATGLLRSYVPFSPVTLDLEELGARFVPSIDRLRGRTALVVGASRGLGADITAALALAGCHVYASARQDDDARRELHERIAAKGGHVEFLAGNASDPAWCESALRLIKERHGRLDAVVLNACAPPQVLRMGPESAGPRERYVRDNLGLVETPIAAFAAPLQEHSGALVYVSSSFVEQAPAGFSHYVAVKQAGEGLLRTVVREQPQLFALVARPPVLRTRWNDTPTGVLGAIPSDWAATHIVNRLADAWAPGRFELLSEFPRPEVTASEDESATVSEFTLRVAASFTTDVLKPALRFWLKELEINGSVDLAPYGQVLQSLLDPGSALNARGRGFNVLLLRVRDWLRELPDEQAGSIEFVRPYLQEMARELEGALRTHRGQASSETLLLICPSHGALSSAESIIVRQTEADIAAAAEAIPGLHVARASDYHARYALNEDQIADPLREEIAHIPYRDEYLHVLATIVARQLHRRLAPIRKVVVVDCDNTLWKGVVGEVGAEGLEFDASHQALHQTLVRLSGTGVLISLCSKNEEADVWRVFETRPDLGLGREHVVAAMINWQPKSGNIRTLASRLSLGLDSFVFIDDNPVECAEVRAGCPEVLTIEWPQDPVAASRLLQHIWEFDPGKFTKEDERRTALYKEEFRRQELRAETSTFEDFVRNLQLTVDFSPLAPDDLRRAAQLTLRTNQFNFTTIRREEADLQALQAGGAHEIRTIRVRDRFGDYGLVGLMIAEKGAEAWGLDTFLLSCRVLGRGVEHRILADLGEMAAAAGASRVRVRIEKTKRNTPARSFLESVVAPELRRSDERSIECDLPSQALASVKFEPSVAGDMTVAEDEGGGSKAAAETDVSRLRRREQQIARTASQWATGAAVKAAVEGRAEPAAAASPTIAEGAVDAVVHDAFAQALGIPVSQVVSVDRLEALGCDSLRIVEITVALSEKFPWLPGTLLFEFQSVSQIVREIVRLSKPGATAVAPTASDRPEKVSGQARAASADIAVVGINVRCAGANSPDELWQLLSGGQTGVTPVPADRRHFLHPLTDTRPHWAGLVDDPGRFDAAFFGVSPREAEFMDPQLRLFLEVAWGALEDAGCVGPDHDSDTGVFAGVMYGDYGALANQSLSGSSNPYRCWEGFSLANRLSQLLGFGGPSLAVDTACSSSGTALHLACRALTAGDCRVAVVGGVNLILDPDRLVSLAKLGILSERGSCEPFGADSDGTVLGEGAGVVVLRPLDEARRRGDRIYGVIKGTGLSTGNGTVGFTAPNPQAQAEAIRRSVRAARVDPRTITYVETHGTGTALGDPIEVRGLTLGYSTAELMEPSLEVAHRCRLGSIKPNIGHLEAGAGIVGLIKVLLQMQHGMLVPSLTSPSPNPQIPFDEIAFDVQRTMEPWERLVVEVNGSVETVPRRAGLSSFGVGGANAHVIVEEPPASDARTPSFERPLHILALSGPSDESLKRQAGELRQFLESHADVPVADACFSVNTGRKPFEQRLIMTAGGRQEWLDRLAMVADGKDPAGSIRGRASAGRVAFLFTGQGSQYAGMGRQLYETQPVFRAALDRCAAVLDSLLDRPLVDLLFAPDGGPEAERLNQTGYTQPALFAIQYALSELWRAWGIRPDLVLGHSVGELAAMCVAGGISLDDGLKLVAARGRLMQALPAGGTMTSVMAAEDRVIQALSGQEDLVTIAAINAPGQIVISGVGTAVADVSARLAADGIKTKALAVSHAFHSPLMRPMLDAYERVVREVRFTTPAIPIVSCVDGVLTPQITHPDYWLRQVMEPVRFTTGMTTLQEQKVTAFVEIGPRPVLLGMGRQCVSDDAADAIAWLPSIRPDAANWQTMLSSVGTLYARGAPVDWKAFDEPYARHRVSVPAYPFEQKQHWLKRRIARPRGEDLIEDSDAEAAAAEAYEIVWRPAAASAPGAGGPARKWILLADEGGVAAALANVIVRDGSEAVLVRAGSGDLRTVWDAAAASGHSPAIVHLWGLDAPLDTLSGIHDAIRTSVGAAVHALQVASRSAGAQPSVWVVTRGAVAAGPGSHPVSVAQSPLWGFARTAALEHPDVWGGIVDLGPGPARSGEIEGLAAELRSRGDDDQSALRDGTRYVPRLVRRNGVMAGKPAFDPTGTYLVTGGLGALGLHVAGWLVRNGARHVVLTSRRGIPDETARSAIASLEKSGARITVAAADVSREADVDALLATIATGPAPLRGVVHAAGVDTRTAIQDLTPGDVQEVLASKVRGGWILHERTRELSLDLFLTFSSIAAILGAAGRAHYGAANAFLDALSLERRRQGLAGLSVNWGPWSGGGMAGASQREQFDRVGNYALDPEDALTALDGLVAARAAQASVAKVDWQRFRGVYEARRRRPLVSELGGHDTAPAAASPDAAEWVARLGQTDAAERLSLLTELLRAEVADTLGFDAPDSVPLDKNLYQLGMDSLMMADLVGRLRKRLGFSTASLVFDHPVVEALAKRLVERLAVADSPATVASTPPPVTATDGTGIDGYSNGVDAEVTAFHKTAWPHRRADWVEPRWRWMLVESARRLGMDPRMWLYRDAGRIVGFTGAIPVRVKLGADERTSAWLVDTMVLEAYRQKAVGSQIMVRAHEDMPFALSLGQTSEMREVQLRLGWKRIAPLEIARLIIRPENVLRGKLPWPAAFAAGWGLRASSAVRALLRERADLQVRAVARFDRRHDRLWESAAPTMTCAIVRDASYLNWKYVDQPGQTFVRLEMLEGNSVTGVAVLMLKEPDNVYSYRRAFLVDLVAPLSDERRLARLIDASSVAAAEHKADVLLCLHISRQLTRSLRAYGFSMRAPERYLLVDPGGLDASATAHALSADAWFVMQGDSDIDRPW